jgi:hypothetical protein
MPYNQYWFAGYSNTFKFLEICLLRRGRVYKLMLAATLSICTSCCLFCLPWLAACKPCPADAAEACPSIGRSGNFKKYQCAPGHYNDLASLFFNTNDDTIRNLYSAGTDYEFQPSSIIIFFVASYFLGTGNLIFSSFFFIKSIYLSMLPFLHINV